MTRKDLDKEKGNTEYEKLVNYRARVNKDWWDKCKALFKKDTKGIVDEDDPEYDAQKIYQHWIKSFR